MKKVLLTALAIFAFGFANAQDGGFRVGLHAGIPMGDAKDIYSANFGADVAYMWPVAENFLAGLTTGYSYYSGKSVEYSDGFTTISVKTNGAFIPVAATGQYTIADKLFLGVDLGYAVYVGDGDGDGGFLYQPKIGYDLGKVDLALSYKGISVTGGTISSVNLSAAYKFGK